MSDTYITIDGQPNAIWVDGYKYIRASAAYPPELVGRLRKEWRSWEGTINEAEGHWLRDWLDHINKVTGDE